MNHFKPLLIASTIFFFLLGFIYPFHPMLLTWIHLYVDPTYDVSLIIFCFGFVCVSFLALPFLQETGESTTKSLNHDAEFSRKINGLNPNMVFIFNLAEEKFTYVNDAFLSTLGYTQQEMQEFGKEFIKLVVSPQDSAKSMRNKDYLEHLNTNNEINDEIRLVHKNGAEIWIKRNVSVFNRDAHQSILSLFGSGTNITKEKLLLIERLNLRDELANEKMISIHSAKMAALGEMSAGIAHEVNTPLGIIKIKADMLIESVEENNLDTKNFLKIGNDISDTVSRIALIVKSLRFFSRDGSSDPFALSSIKNIVDETLSLCTEKFTAQGVQLKLKVPDSQVQIECRASEISQVLLNLISNSLEAVQTLNEKWIYIDVHDQDSDLEISVTDSGNGITQDVQDKMMNPFFTTKEFGAGSGLGLSISRGIILSHNGVFEFDIQSKKTRFVIRIPKTQNAELKVS